MTRGPARIVLCALLGIVACRAGSDAPQGPVTETGRVVVLDAGALDLKLPDRRRPLHLTFTDGMVVTRDGERVDTRALTEGADVRATFVTVGKRRLVRSLEVVPHLSADPPEPPEELR